MLTLSLCLRYTHRYLEIGIEIPKTYFVYIYIYIHLRMVIMHIYMIMILDHVYI